MVKSTGIIIQARTGSTRFPNKVINKIDNITLIEILINRLKLLGSKVKIIIATTKLKEDDVLVDIAKENNVLYYRGSTNNVLSRYYNAAKLYNLETIVRITSDWPLIDMDILKIMLVEFNISNNTYLSNIRPPTFPDGYDIEIFNFISLKQSYINPTTKFEKEHVTPYIINSTKTKKANFNNPFGDFSHLRITIDYYEDLILLKKIINKSNYLNFTLKDLLKKYKTNKKLFDINLKFTRNEASFLNSGQKLWLRANQIIAGGNSLLSKKPEIFLDKKWPTYYSKAKGCYIWDLDGNKYIDLCAMGVGTNILGYANKDVDKAVTNSIKMSNMSTFNSPHEVRLAENLLSINKWADKVKFTRSGGESSALAVRLSRALNPNKNIAICGYHGWHDWYLSLQLNKEKNLKKFLFPKIQIKGVPKNLKGTCYSFIYNDFNSFKKLVLNKNIGIVQMEVKRNLEPEDNFLYKVNNFCKNNNIILILDECTSGFRETFGGIYSKYKLDPDLLILGKALGNGYAIGAVLGKKNIMDQIDNTFISSTFWSEQIGYVAANKTLEIMKKQKTWVEISKIGDLIVKNWIKLSKKHKLNLEVYGLRSLPTFVIVSANHKKYVRFITQEMLKANILATATVYVSIAHSNTILKKYFKKLDVIFALISKCEKKEESIDSLIDDNIVDNLQISRFN